MRNRLQEDVYYWDEKKVEEILNIINKEVKLMSKFSELLRLDEDIVFVGDVTSQVMIKIQNGQLPPIWMLRYHPKSSDEEIKTLISKLESIIYLNQFELTSHEISNELEKLLILTEKHENNLREIFSDSEIVLSTWLQQCFEEEISEEIKYDLINEIYNHTKRNPRMHEADLLNHLRSAQRKIKVKALQNEINRELENTIGTSDIKSFLREKKIPISLIKYFRSFAELQTKNLIDVPSLFVDLVKINQLSEVRLQEIITQLRTLRDSIFLLSDEDIHKEIFKTFLGREWIEGIFEDKHLEDLIKYLAKDLGDSVESWSDIAIKNEFDKWRKEKYRELFYESLKSKINSLDEKSSKELIIKLLEDPAIGLQIAKHLEVSKI